MSKRVPPKKRVSVSFESSAKVWYPTVEYRVEAKIPPAPLLSPKTLRVWGGEERDLGGGLGMRVFFFAKDPTIQTNHQWSTQRRYLNHYMPYFEPNHNLSKIPFSIPLFVFALNHIF